LVQSNKKHGINGPNLNNSKYFNKLSEKWYTNIVNIDEKIIYIGEIQNIVARIFGIYLVKNINYQKIYKTDNIYINKNKNYIIINPGASSKFRRLELHKFIEIIESIQ
jgi:ADP-heptose:LPS heptosyltransferase